MSLKQALKEEQLDLKATFRHGTSVQPMFNLIQYYMNNEPTERVKIFFWLRTLLQVAKGTGKDSIFDEAYATLCILNNERHQLDEFVKVAVEKYKDQFPEIYYCRLSSLLAAEQDKARAQQMATRALELEAKFIKDDPYVFKRKFMAEEELKL